MTSALQKVFLSLSLICLWDSGDCNSMSYSTCSSYSLTLTLLPLRSGICSPTWIWLSVTVMLVTPNTKSQKVIYFLPHSLGTFTWSSHRSVGSPSSLRRGPHRGSKLQSSAAPDWTPSQDQHVSMSSWKWSYSHQVSWCHAERMWGVFHTDPCGHWS